MKKIFKILTPMLAVALVACGGGGGSPGTTQESYSITLRADKTQLPINVANVSPGIGVYAPFTTILYVQGAVGGRPIPGGENIFSCNVAGGLNSGALYYPDGDDDHMTEIDDGNGGKIKIPKAFRSITLGSNSGGDSFLFHSGNAAGTTRITCSVTDPRDKQQKSASVEINVGGATGKPASVRVNSSIPNYNYNYLGTKNNVAGFDNQMAMVAFVMDDANQPVAGSSAPNLQVSIRSAETTASGARLLAGNQSDSVLQLNTGGGGTAQYSLLSGDETGVVVLEFTADRYDNNVQNGIDDPVSSLHQVYVVKDITTRLAVVPTSFDDLTNGVPFFYMMEAQGGLPPYTWTITGLPAGLTADSAGIITGTPNEEKGTYRAKATVTDKNKTSVSADIAFTLGDKPINPADFYISSCQNYGIDQDCPLPSVRNGEFYAYSFTASVSGVTWEILNKPGWLNQGAATEATGAGTAGYIYGTPAEACGKDSSIKQSFLIKATKGGKDVTRRASITVTGIASCPTAP